MLKALLKNTLSATATVLLSASATSAWAAQGDDPVTPKAFEYNRTALLKALEVMDARRCEVQTLLSSLNIVIIDNQTGKKQGLEGVYFGDANGNFRMRINWQDATIVDLAFQGEEVTLYLPKKERFYKGKKKDLVEAKACALSLLANAGNAHDLFFPRAWTPRAVGRRLAMEDGNEVIKVIEKNNPSGPKEEERLARKVFITKDSPSASMIEVFDCNKNAQGNIRYGTYKDLPVEGNSGVNLAYPATVTLTQADGARSLQMEIKELDLNIPIKEEKFVINKPDDLKVQDLGECLKSGKNPWE
jgi:hypothetical protein